MKTVLFWNKYMPSGSLNLYKDNFIYNFKGNCLLDNLVFPGVSPTRLNDSLYLC